MSKQIDYTNCMYPLVSCIIPIYNAEQYLHRCLDSICNQTYKNLEIILVNDGSTDNSKKICDNYANKHSNIIALHTSNNGASIARQKGIQISKGEYICFVDSDDYVTSEYISTLYELIIHHNTSISACNVNKIRPGYFNHKTSKCYSTIQKLCFEEIMPRFFNYEFWSFWGKLYQRKTFDQIMFPNDTISEDYVVMMQIFCKERRMVYTEEPLYFYEYHPNSLSNQQLSRRAFEEYNNVKIVYEQTLALCPQYKEFAFSNLIGTSVKLFILKKQDKNHIFDNYFHQIQRFLANNKLLIYRCNNLNLKTKFIALGISMCPNITLWLYNNLKS